MPEMNYSDAERRAYVDASPAAVLLARIADLEHENEELRGELATAREKAYAEGYGEGQLDPLPND